MKRFESQDLQDLKKKLQVDLIGVAAVDQSPELKERAALFLPTARSVVVFAKETYKAVVALLAPTKEAGAAEPGEVFTTHTAYIYGRLTRAVHETADLFLEEGYRSVPLSSPSLITDERFVQALFSYKHAAVLAGLGTLGKHSLLITPEFGPRVRLACLLTEAPLEETPPPPRLKNPCARCQACIKVCPAQAIRKPEPGQPYAIDRFACRAYRQAGLVCSVCLKVCDKITG